MAGLRVLGLLLSGGAGRRMGGREKGWLLLAGQPLVRHVLQRLAPQVDSVLISANRCLPDYRQLGWPVLCDAPAWHGMGPLAGLASLARAVPTGVDAVQLMPCDTPLLPENLVARLAALLDSAPDCLACYPETADGPQPGMLLVRVAALATLENYLQQGGRSLRGWLSLLAARTVRFDSAAAFANANDPASLQQLEQHLRQQGQAAANDQDAYS